MIALAKRGASRSTWPSALCALGTVAVLTGCGGGGSPIPPSAHTFAAGVTAFPMVTADESSGGPCSVSSDGFIWYAIPSGALPPIDFTTANCRSAASIDANGVPPAPAWSFPKGATQAIFVATSLQEDYSFAGMQQIEQVAETAHVPVTWMIGNAQYLTQNASYYTTVHASNGDDVELEDGNGLYAEAQATLPFYAPAVSVQGAGHERAIAQAIAYGNAGFWGITWNSHGTDNTSDEGAPWGTYCADVSSYKRPSPTGDCSLVAFEWTARDLTRAYLTDTSADGYSAEAAFSTDPDDVTDRADFTPQQGAAYVRRIADAYAAAGVSQPLVMMSQQESIDEGTDPATNNPILQALYQEAVSTGMQPVTLRQALTAAKTFSAQPRAIAFPFIPGGRSTPYNGAAFAPATIDFHDDVAGMTFLSGHTMPARLFEYAQDPTSAFNVPLAETLPTSPSYPTLTGATFANGMLHFAFNAPQAIHVGVAIWSDPALLGLSGANVTPAGHAGAVVTFDLPPGPSMQAVACSGCTSTTFTFSN